MNSKLFLPTKTPFKSKITCKGITSTSSVSTGGKYLKPSINNSSPISFSIISWRIGRSFSSLAPLNPTRGDYGHNGTNGLEDGKDPNVHWGKDTKPQHNEGWTRDDIGFFRFSSKLTTFPMQFNVIQLSKKLNDCPLISMKAKIRRWLTLVSQILICVFTQSSNT